MRVVPLSEAVAVNPKIDRTQLADDTPISFVPMAAVGAADGHIDTSTVRPYAEVKKGYTHFRENDVLFAKVTPCMENGKMAVARNLKNGMGFGSTEFHVLRPREGVDARYVYHFVSSQTFRKEAARHMTGAVGLRRVPTAFLESAEIPLPPLEAQREIVAELEKQFSRLDEAVANLQRVKANLKRYKASVLKAAVEGRLVETEATLAHREGRSYETGEQLLGRILDERRVKWNGKGKYKEPATLNRANQDDLPIGWTWATWDEIGASQNGRPFPSSEYTDSGIKLLRPGNMHESGVLVWTTKNTQHLPPNFALENPDHMIGSNELVMNLTAQSLKDDFLGRICLTSMGEQCLLNQRLARLTPRLVSSAYAYLVFKSPQFRQYVEGLNTGSLIQHMFTTQLATFPCPLPPLAEQVRIVAEVDRHLSIIREVEAEVDANLHRASALRQSTLRKAFETP